MSLLVNSRLQDSERKTQRAAHVPSGASAPTFKCEMRLQEVSQAVWCHRPGPAGCMAGEEGGPGPQRGREDAPPGPVLPRPPSGSALSPPFCFVCF